MDRKEFALEKFGDGFNCAQSVLSAFSSNFGLDENNALKIAAGFGGGCRCGEVCGAVTGAIMVLGLKYGHCRKGDVEAKNNANAKTVNLIGKFKDINRTIVCRELLGYDLTKEEDYKIMLEKNLFKTECVRFIGDAVGILEEIL